MHQDVRAAIGEADDQVHQDKLQIVMPARTFLAPEACVPSENLFLNGAEHDQDQTESRKLGENSKTPKATPKLPATSAMPRKMVKAWLIPMLLATFKIAIAAVDKD